MNRLDLFLLAVLALAAWTGWRRGAVFRVFSWGGMLFGITAGAMLAPAIAAGVSDPTGQALRAILTVGICWTLGGMAGRLLGHLVRGGTRRTAIGKVDSFLGAVLSVAVVALIAWFLGLNLSNGPNGGLAEEIRGSAILRGLDAAMPEPPVLLARVRAFLASVDFPQVFADLPPEPTEPVRAATKAQVQSALSASSQATVMVTGRACARMLEGSGFVVAPGYVLTNAHVVAGVDAPEVRGPDGASQPGSVVLFDPQLDAAVIRVASTAEPLPLTGETSTRGQVGAVVGYPRGGAQTASGAAVTRLVEAQGRDIYDEARVRRSVYELQTVVVEGNSGSPFVLPDGKVAGMVFASATGKKPLGYAVTSQQLEPDIQAGVIRTQPVDTGACLD